MKTEYLEVLFKQKFLIEQEIEMDIEFSYEDETRQEAYMKGRDFQLESKLDIINELIELYTKIHT